MRRPQRASRPGGTRCRCSATSNIPPTSSASITSIRMRRRAASPADIDRHLRQFQYRGRGRQGLARAGRGADLRNADDAIAGRGRDRIRLAGGSRRASRRFRLGHLSSSQGGALARWQAGDAGRRDLLARGAEETQPDVRVLLPPRRQSRKDRRARRQVHFRRRRATANCRPSSASCTVLPKHWWEGTDSQGRKRDISATTLEKPLGSGPYRIKEFVAGRSVALERVKDYWGAKPAGADRARTISTNCASNFSATTWSRWKPSRPIRPTGSPRTRPSNGRPPMIFPRLRKSAWSRKNSRSTNSGRMQGFVFNIRRDQFKDARLRRAFNYAFDFEEMNKQLFYGQYKRINSYFDGTELASSGLPEGQELEILETVRDKVPAEVFTTPYHNPVGGNPEAVRANLRESARLLKEAGFEVRDRKLVDAAGKPVSVEILVQDPSAERIALFYKPSLERIGVTASIRVVDDAQYENRLRSFDFDMIIDLWGESLSPGNEQREFWGSQAADQPGSQKYHRHQESRRRCADRQGDLRQGSRRSGRRDQGARPRAAVEFLCRAAIHLSASRAMRAGIASAMPSRCRNTAVRDCRRCGGSTPTRPPGSASDLEGFFAHGAVLPPACARPRRRRARRGAGCGRRAAAEGGAGRAWHIGVRRPEISGRLSSFRLCQSGRAEGRHVFADPLGARLQSVVPDLQFASMPTSSRARARRAWT